MSDAPWWIGPISWQDEAHPASSPPWAFVREFDLATLPTDAHIDMTAAAGYVLWINGVLVGSGPARSFPGRMAVDRLRPIALLRPGRNRLAIALIPSTGVAGYGVPTRMGLWVEAHVGDLVIVSDASWRGKAMEWTGHCGLLASLPTAAQEHHRHGGSDDRWMADAAVEGWHAARLLGGAGTPPWLTMEPRPVPLLTETPVVPRVVWRGSAPAEVADPAMNLARRFNDGACTGSAVAEPGAEIDAAPGTVTTFDLGHTRAIRPGLSVAVPDPGCRLEVFYDIAMGERPTASMGFGSRTEGFADSFTPSGTGEWQGLAWRGCRYVTVRVVGGNCRYRLMPRVIAYPFPDDAGFTCADPAWQRIWDLGVATLRSSVLDVPVDTCWREMSCWTFDACVQGKAAFLTFGDARPWRRALDLIGQGIDPQGLPRAIVPAGDSFMILPDQALGWVRSCGEYVWLTGDVGILDAVLPGVHRLLARCLRDLTADDLYIPPDCCWHWVDWAPVEHRAYALPLNALLLVAARAAHGLADRSGHGKLAAVADGLISRLKPALARFRDPAGGGLLAHLPGPPGTRTNGFGARKSAARHGIHGNALALTTDVADPMVLAACRRFVGDANSLDGDFGIGWSDWLLQPLADHGHAADAVAGLMLRCRPGLDAGLVTWGENWKPRIHNSAHGWAAAGNSLIVGALCGLSPVAPGWAAVHFSPCPGMPDWSYRLRTPHGELRASMTDGVAELHLPGGCVRA